jgi:glycosyltransferase involved in cell wall biosynthesis
LRVAIVVASLRILGGQAVQAQRIIDGWRGDPAVEAWIVPINPVPPPPLDRLLDIKYVRTLMTQLCYWPLLFRELRTADVVHVFSASYSAFLLSTIPAVVVSRVLRKPILLNYHSGEAPDHLERSSIARRTLQRYVHWNVVPSPFLRDVLGTFGIPAQVVSNTIDLREFSYRVRDPLRPRLLSTRNFEPLYNVACVLRAFARVQARYADASLTLVGSGSQETALRALVAELSLRHVAFAGRVAPSDIARFYADADIYLQAPAIDNMPLSVLEAFASGCPVVSTSVGGVPAILTDGVHGLLARDDDADGLAAQVLHLLEHPDRARRMAAAAKESCLAYDWRVVREQWLAAYRETVRRARIMRPADAQRAAAEPQGSI